MHVNSCFVLFLWFGTLVLHMMATRIIARTETSTPIGEAEKHATCMMQETFNRGMVLASMKLNLKDGKSLMLQDAERWTAQGAVDTGLAYTLISPRIKGGTVIPSNDVQSIGWLLNASKCDLVFAGWGDLASGPGRTKTKWLAEMPTQFILQEVFHVWSGDLSATQLLISSEYKGAILALAVNTTRVLERLTTGDPEWGELTRKVLAKATAQNKTLIDVVTEIVVWVGAIDDRNTAAGLDVPLEEQRVLFQSTHQKKNYTFHQFLSYYNEFSAKCSLESVIGIVYTNSSTAAEVAKLAPHLLEKLPLTTSLVGAEFSMQMTSAKTDLGVTLPDVISEVSLSAQLAFLHA